MFYSVWHDGHHHYIIQRDFMHSAVSGYTTHRFLCVRRGNRYWAAWDPGFLPALVPISQRTITEKFPTSLAANNFPSETRQPGSIYLIIVAHEHFENPGTVPGRWSASNKKSQSGGRKRERIEFLKSCICMSPVVPSLLALRSKWGNE